MRVLPSTRQGFRINNRVASPASAALHPARRSDAHFPHAFVKMTEGSYKNVASRVGKPDPEYIVVNGVPYAMGRKAQRYGSFKRQLGAPRYTAEYYGVFLAYGLARTFGKSTKDIFLMGTHSPRDVAYAGNLLEAGCRTWDVEYLGKHMTFNVVDGSTADEPLGGWANAILRKDGVGYANKNINDGYTIVLDIGAFTTDGLVVDPGGAIDYGTANGVTIVLDIGAIGDEPAEVDANCGLNAVKFHGCQAASGMNDPPFKQTEE